MKNFIYILALVFAPQLVCQAATVENDQSYVEEEYVNYRISPNPLERLAPYRERRMNTGALFSIGYSQFRPMNYDPDFTVSDFDSVYGGDTTQMYDLSFLYKLNIALGSVAIGLGVGYQKLLSDFAFGDTALSVVPLRLEAQIVLDTLFENPSIVPYGLGGAYTVYYREEQASSAKVGTTLAAPYFGGGLALRLDGFFDEQSYQAYKENFQENTFFTVEARKWIESNTDQDPDFSTGIQFGVGLRFEF